MFMHGMRCRGTVTAMVCNSGRLMMLVMGSALHHRRPRYCTEGSSNKNHQAQQAKKPITIVFR